MEAANRGARDGARPVDRLQHRAALRAEPRTRTSIRWSTSATSSCARRCSSSTRAAFVIFPGGFGTLDELFEALTLIQTGKISHFPVVLFGTHYWQGLLDWLRDTVLADGKIGESDLELMQLTDDPEDAAARVIAAKH